MKLKSPGYCLKKKKKDVALNCPEKGRLGSSRHRQENKNQQDKIQKGRKWDAVHAYARKKGKGHHLQIRAGGNFKKKRGEED